LRCFVAAIRRLIDARHTTAPLLIYYDAAHDAVMMLSLFLLRQRERSRRATTLSLVADIFIALDYAAFHFTLMRL